MDGHLEITCSAIDGPALRGIKRYRRDQLAPGTLGLDIDTITLTGRASSLDSIKTLVLFLFAGLAALWRICKALGPVECLLAGCPYELLTAIDALDLDVLKARLYPCSI